LWRLEPDRHSDREAAQATQMMAKQNSDIAKDVAVFVRAII
jgi:hypothetical protein